MSDLYARERAEHFLASRDEPTRYPRRLDVSRYGCEEPPSASDLAADERE